MAPAKAIVCVTLSLVGSIRSKAAPSVLATQIDPPPLTRLPGCPPTRIRSTTAPEVGSTRETAPPLGSATHTEPALVVIAPGAPASAVVPARRPELGSNANSRLTPAANARGVDAAPEPSKAPTASAHDCGSCPSGNENPAKA